MQVQLQAQENSLTNKGLVVVQVRWDWPAPMPDALAGNSDTFISVMMQPTRAVRS